MRDKCPGLVPEAVGAVAGSQFRDRMELPPRPGQALLSWRLRCSMPMVSSVGAHLVSECNA